MHKTITTTLVAVTAVAALSACNVDDSSNAAGKSHHHTADNKDKAGNSGKTVSGTSAYGTAKLPLQNGDWRLDSVQVKNDGLGDFGGTARITYTGDDGEGGDNIFTLTVFKGTKVAGTLNGSANTVKPGTAVTVQLISTDKFVAGPFKYDFQNDL
jgi:hypothetical protein